MTIEEIKNNAEELYKCSTDPVYFAEKYLKFNGKEPLKLKDSQKQQLRMLCNNDNARTIISGARYGKQVVANAAKQYLDWRESLS